MSAETSAYEKMPTALQPFELPMEGPQVTYDVALGNTFAYVDVYTDRLHNVMAGHGMDSVEIAAASLHMSAKTLESTNETTGEVSYSYGSFSVTTKEINLFLGSSYETFKDIPVTGTHVPSVPMTTRATGTVVHEVSHLADYTGHGEPGAKLKAKTHELGHALRGSLPQTVGVASVAAVSVGFERLAAAVDLYHTPAIVLGSLSLISSGMIFFETMKTKVRSMRANKNVDNFYYNHPDEVRACRRADEYRDKGGDSIVMMITHEDMYRYAAERQGKDTLE